MLRSFDMNLKSCDSSTESSQNRMTLVDRDYSNNAGWNWTYPAVEIQFDSQTANFTLSGYAAAIPYYINRADSLKSLGPDEVQGTIKVSFSGVIDSYHSDILVNTSSTPTWQRTVGFGNNSMNIGYDSGSFGFPRALYWEAATICSVVSLALVSFWLPSGNCTYACMTILLLMKKNSLPLQWFLGRWLYLPASMMRTFGFQVQFPGIFHVV